MLGLLALAVHPERHPHADLHLLCGQGFDAAHHPETLCQVDEDDAVWVCVPPVDGRSGVDGPTSGTCLPDEVGAAADRADHPRIEDRRSPSNAGSRSSLTPDTACRPRMVARQIPPSSVSPHRGASVLARRFVACEHFSRSAYECQLRLNPRLHPLFRACGSSRARPSSAASRCRGRSVCRNGRPSAPRSRMCP